MEQQARCRLSGAPQRDSRLGHVQARGPSRHPRHRFALTKQGASARDSSTAAAAAAAPPPPPVTLGRPTPPQLPPQPMEPAPPLLPEPSSQPPAAATSEAQPSDTTTAAPPDLISSRTRSKTRDSVGVALAAVCLKNDDADGIILIAHSSTKPSAEPRSHAEAMRDDPKNGAPPNRASSRTTARTRPSSSSTAPLRQAPTPSASASCRSPGCTSANDPASSKRGSAW